MKLIHEKCHPNGFKVVLASTLSGSSLDTSVSTTSVRCGAQLQLTTAEHVTINIDPNSAVLKVLGGEISSTDLQWLDWEIVLQETLIPYFHCLSSGKEDKSLAASLTAKLQHLNAAVPSPPQFLSGKLGSADIVLLGALLPLLTCPARKLVEIPKSLADYLAFLRSQPRFKEAEAAYFWAGGVSLEQWSANQALIPSSKASTSKLLKGGQQVAPKSVSSSGESSASPSTEPREVTDLELKDSEAAWLEGPPPDRHLKSRSTPVIPVKGESNVLITSALPYVNNVPHLGNIIGCVLSADCFARFCRLRGDNVLYICGTDEYGTATETKALSEGATPQQICDKYHAIHSDVYKWFNIDFDFFGRTTTKSQTVAAQSIFWDLHKNNKITEKSVEQLYCGKCERFLADRFVEGTCPFAGCGYEDARGDQCDACGKLVNATELVKPRCKLCSQTPSVRASTHLFLDLPQIEPELREWVSEVSPQWSANAKVICESWLRDGLRERCITRDLKWGTPVPLEGFESKVFYVWYDAPIGYISMAMEYTDQWRLWWKDPEAVSYYQFMAKDNVPFHGVIFPSCLLGTGDTWTKVTHLFATEYLNYEEGKFSKSRGVGVFGDQAAATGIPSDVWRFYLLYVRPEGHDTAFSWSDLQTKNNSELLNNLGNFVNRALKFVYQFYKGVVPEASPNESDFKMMSYVNQEIKRYTKALGSCRLKDGIRSLLSITRIGNQYIQENEPYKLIKPDRSDEDKRRGATVISISVNLVALVAVLLQPYMPHAASTIFSTLNLPQTLTSLPSAIVQFIKSGHQINEPSPLIRKITDDEIAALKSQFAGSPSHTPAKPKRNAQVQVAAQGGGGEGGKAGGDPAQIQRLEALIADQGTKVRDLKGQGVAKDVLGVEIEQLLKLKETLSLEQGLDPAAVRGGGKKNKKK